MNFLFFQRQNLQLLLKIVREEYEHIGTEEVGRWRETVLLCIRIKNKYTTAPTLNSCTQQNTRCEMAKISGHVSILCTEVILTNTHVFESSWIDCCGWCFHISNITHFDINDSDCIIVLCLVYCSLPLMNCLIYENTTTSNNFKVT